MAAAPMFFGLFDQTRPLENTPNGDELSAVCQSTVEFSDATLSNNYHLVDLIFPKWNRVADWLREAERFSTAA